MAIKSKIQTIYRIISNSPYFYEVREDIPGLIEIFYYEKHDAPTSGRISINRDDANELFEVLKKMLGKGEYD